MLGLHRIWKSLIPEAVLVMVCDPAVHLCQSTSGNSHSILRRNSASLLFQPYRGSAAVVFFRTYRPFSTRNRIKSFTLLEYPHSLSYQLMTLPVLVPTTFVSRESKMLLSGLPRKSVETSSSSV